MRINSFIYFVPNLKLLILPLILAACNLSAFSSDDVRPNNEEIIHWLGVADSTQNRKFSIPLPAKYNEENLSKIIPGCSCINVQEDNTAQDNSHTLYGELKVSPSEGLQENKIICEFASGGNLVVLLRVFCLPKMGFTLSSEAVAISKESKSSVIVFSTREILQTITVNNDNFDLKITDAKESKDISGLYQREIILFQKAKPLRKENTPGKLLVSAGHFSKQVLIFQN